MYSFPQSPLILVVNGSKMPVDLAMIIIGLLTLQWGRPLTRLSSLPVVLMSKALEQRTRNNGSNSNNNIIIISNITITSLQHPRHNLKLTPTIIKVNNNSSSNSRTAWINTSTTPHRIQATSNLTNPTCNSSRSAPQPRSTLGCKSAGTRGQRANRNRRSPRPPHPHPPHQPHPTTL